MTSHNTRKRNTFVKKVDRLTNSLEALEKLAGTARRLLKQVAGIVVIFSVVTGVLNLELLPLVDRAVTLLGSMIG